MRNFPLPVLILALLPLSAAQAETRSTLTAGNAHMSYVGSAMGLSVMRVQAALAMDRSGYRVDVTYGTTGLFSAFMRTEQHSWAQGLWQGRRPAPQRFYSWGHVRGQPRETLLDYDAGQPVLRTLQPPNAGDRDEVPAAERRNTIDTLSALALLVQRVADDGRCDGTARVFDGRRLSEVSARTVAEVVLPPESDAAYAGPSLRCDFLGRQLAGFSIDSDREWQQRPHGGSVWFARAVPGVPPVPVRMTFETRWFGDVTMVLTAAGPGPGPSAAR
ncbi:DUF3108 domain-containing protein [Rhodovastum atsumiense]|nr:DUF3108 domain-containing protein [Rhodovastum atsumiense]